ncbi:MAG TPA: hypothetical protein VD993_01150 [Chitinophagaceae bacterium]|nr:hypothetical protein [Chitinophagaceae bacterium]
MKEEKMGLVKPQKINQEELVQGYCGSGYYKSATSVACQSGYSCNQTAVGSVPEDFDVLT